MSLARVALPCLIALASMSTSRAVEIHVTDDSDDPVADAIVRFYTADELPEKFLELRTDEDGSCATNQLPLGQTEIQIIVQSEGSSGTLILEWRSQAWSPDPAEIRIRDKLSISEEGGHSYLVRIAESE